MKHNFEYKFNEKACAITIYSELFGLTIAYEIDDSNEVFMSSSAGSDSKLCCIYALDESELHEFLENKDSCDEFLSELDAPYVVILKHCLLLELEFLKTRLLPRNISK